MERNKKMVITKADLKRVEKKAKDRAIADFTFTLQTAYKVISEKVLEEAKDNPADWLLDGHSDDELVGILQTYLHDYYQGSMPDDEDANINAQYHWK
jgi:hypothetical protein